LPDVVVASGRQAERRPERRLHEGRDFVGQAEVPVRIGPESRCAMSRLATRLTTLALLDLEAQQRGGAGPGCGVEGHAWWRVALWREAWRFARR
jgi:hypothetical protein